MKGIFSYPSPSSRSQELHYSGQSFSYPWNFRKRIAHEVLGTREARRGRTLPRKNDAKSFIKNGLCNGVSLSPMDTHVTILAVRESVIVIRQGGIVGLYMAVWVYFIPKCVYSFVFHCKRTHSSLRLALVVIKRSDSSSQALRTTSFEINSTLSEPHSFLDYSDFAGGAISRSL